jgi:hypothetical protein
VSGEKVFSSFGMRFLLVGVVPVYAAGTFLIVLVWAGAPGELHFNDAWKTAVGLKAGEGVLLTVALVLVALLSTPFQIRLARLFEGFWPGDLARPWAERAGERARELDQRAAAMLAGTPGPEAVQKAGELGAYRRRRYPDKSTHLRPTRLGNTLAAAETRAGRAYGWDAVVAWPRLYPVLGGEVRKAVDDHRNTLDTAMRLAAVAGLTAPAVVGLLWSSGWWVLLALLPVGLSFVAYQVAVEAAQGFGESLAVAFDLHRFDLLRALRLPLPADRDAERKQAEDICAFWRQGKPVAFVYDPAEPVNVSVQNRL